MNKLRFSVFTDTDWTYPDMPLEEDPAEGSHEIFLETARLGHDGCQLVLDASCNPSKVTVRFCWDEEGAPKLSLYEMLPVTVNENTSSTLMTTLDYESCRDFVTRRAPFEVYDALRPFNGRFTSPRAALFLSVSAAADARPGLYHGALTVEASGLTEHIPVACRVHCATVASLSDARLGMLNFFNYDGITLQHGVPLKEEQWWKLYRSYVRSQVAMRCTHILLPAGEPLYDAAGAVSGFDFSFAVRCGRIAFEEGAVYICGAHIAHWNEWDEKEYYLSWSPHSGITTQEGYLQLKKYFSAWAEAIRENNWEGRVTQALADEPQIHNADTYRILAAIFRKFLPGVPIIDAVETTDLGGGIDIWVPKQDTYEKWRETFDMLKENGEEMWFYTCAFPAGPIMNRSMDIPLSASRLVLWMGALYRLTGFLHWGFNFYIGDDVIHSACCPHKGALLPAGDAHIVYPCPDGPMPSLRYMAQLTGAEDYELLMQLTDRRPDTADRLIREACTSFRDYTADGRKVKRIRGQLLEAAACMLPL